MKLSTPSFRGMAPRVTPRGLPDNAAQEVINAKLLTGDLEAWNAPLMVKQLAESGSSGAIESIFLLKDKWLSFNRQVEVERGIIPGDDTFRTYITGLDAPRFTNYDLATTGPEPYPVETRLLGVPAPSDAPSLVLVPQNIVEGEIPVINGGAETGNDAGWIQITPDLAVYGVSSVPGLLPFEGDYYFYGGTAASGEYYQAFSAASVDVVDGQSLTLKWAQASGDSGSQAQLGLRFYDADSVLITETFADMVAASPAKTWQERTVTTAVPAGTSTFRIVMKFLNVGGGVTDAFIDAITLRSSAVDYLSTGNDLSSWTVSPNTGVNIGNNDRTVTQVNIGGEYGDVFKFTADEARAWIWRTFAFNRASEFSVRYDLMLNSTRCQSFVGLGLTGGAGEGIKVTLAGANLESFTSLNGVSSSGASLASFSPQPLNQWLRIEIAGAKSGASRFDLTITITNKQTGQVYLNAAAASATISGAELVFNYFCNRDADGQAQFLDNIAVRVVPDPNAFDPNDGLGISLTSYVYRYVNDFGEASAPGLPSRTIQRTAGVSVTVTTPVDVPVDYEDYGITYKQIYRAATGSQGTVFRFVAEIPLAQADYIDTLEDFELGEVLDSDDWDLPPSDMRYILALPNGIMVGASKNQLCLSVQNRPHAWPIRFRLSTDTYITGLANIDTSVIIGTKSFVYTASGNSPDSYSMSKPGAPQACVSARSFAYLLDVGAVFASPDGLMVANGPTSVVNLTETVFTREQWQALDPTSIIGVAHDDIYFFFFDNGVDLGGYAIDMKKSGFGLIKLGMHAAAVFVDPEADDLYLLLDSYEEPT